MSREEIFDREVRKRVQSVEQDIPPELEKAFLEELKAVIPEKEKQEPRRHPVVYYGGLAAAVLLAAFLFLFYFFHQAPGTLTAEEEEVWVQAARVEGKRANTVVVNTTDPDITIVWIEKIKNDYK